MNPNLIDLYAGFSGITLIPESFDLGEGIFLSQTYAHLMAPYIMAFKPAAPGKAHPGPWKPARGGVGIDITVELRLPLASHAGNFDRLNTIWLIAALIRLKVGRSTFVPLISSEPFASIVAIKEEPELWPMESHVARPSPLHQPGLRLDIPELEWLRTHWLPASELFANENFSVAFQAVDRSTGEANRALALVEVWGALERLFSASTQELSFRVSANVASFLEEPGHERYVLFKNVRGLYDHRSKAAHGDGNSVTSAYQDTLALARRALLKMIEAHHVPTKTELEASLFGDGAALYETTSSTQ